MAIQVANVTAEVAARIGGGARNRRLDLLARHGLLLLGLGLFLVWWSCWVPPEQPVARAHRAGPLDRLSDYDAGNVLDYNNDGWPDLLTTSLAPWRRASSLTMAGSSGDGTTRVASVTGWWTPSSGRRGFVLSSST